MTGLERMTANLLSAANDNTLALASLKFDFSLVKLEAPAEFSGLGAALSTRRRSDAEDGPHHKTARRLAALFEQLIPSTPKLITAYGLRSSEIIQTPGINPKGSTKHGPFEAFVGADGTAMWAAATSGIPALGVYLLACLLARAWDTKEAISIWVELVAKRRIEIEEMAKGNHAVSESTRVSVKQDISREDLARWDASVRAWLRSADQAKYKEQTQLMLIIKNIDIPFNGGETTYGKVVEAWRQAMSGLENLLCGLPQRIDNRAILLAFSAWHLYPDLVVLGKETKHIKFNDHCVDPRGIGTISLERVTHRAGQGTSWSLALSHLRYYGGSVTVESCTDFSRVTIQQLHIIVLGNIFYDWDIGQRDDQVVAQWFVDVWNFLHQKATHKRSLKGLDWFRALAQAAKEITETNAHRRENALQLFTYGKRRAKRFLGASAKHLEPFFGLANEAILAGLSEIDEEERSVAYLRNVAEMEGLRSGDAYIRSDRKVTAANQLARISEYMTAVPHTCGSRKRDIDGNRIIQTVHVRWLYAEPLTNTSDPLEMPKQQMTWNQRFADRIQYLAERHEQSMGIIDIPSPLHKPWWQWDSPPSLFSDKRQPKRDDNCDGGNQSLGCLSIDNPSHPCKCFEAEGEPVQALFREYQRVGRSRLFLKDKVEHSRTGFQVYVEARGRPYLHPRLSAEKLCMSSMKADNVSAYLQHLMTPASKRRTSKDVRPSARDDGNEEHTEEDSGEESGKETKSPTSVDQRPEIHREDWASRMRKQSFESINGMEDLANVFPKSKDRIWAIKALTLATRIYLQLEGATISLKIVDDPLDKAPWLTKRLITAERAGSTEPDWSPSEDVGRLDRSYTLSCIAHFEAGSPLLIPEELEETLAIASGNSIFVIGALVSDPFYMVAEDTVKRIVGNIGRTGICLLVAPIDPQIRSLSDQYNLVNHAPYNGKRENRFEGTSLHLSFTDWVLPLDVKGKGNRTIDQEAYIVESVISVLDCGNWVADLDILRINFRSLRTLQMEHICPGHPEGCEDYDYTSIDGWEELLDGPTTVGFFRAHGNWAARLAAVSILSQKDQDHSFAVLGADEFCLQCLSSQFDYYGGVVGLRKYESPLPSICID